MNLLCYLQNLRRIEFKESPLHWFEHSTADNSPELYAEKCDQSHPCGFLGRLKINAIRGDSIDRSLQRKRLLQHAGSQLASLSVPEIAGIKLPHLECTDVQYQQSFCRLKILLLYGLVNTDLVTLPPPPPRFCP